MTSSLDMSLDDLIKKNKEIRGASSRGRRGTGPSRRLPNRLSNRAAPYSALKSPALVPLPAPDSLWQHDMFVDQVAQGGRAAAIETGTKLYISNLDYGVSNEDIKELFSEVGDLKRYGIHYDRSGRSKGTAEVVFSRRPDALAAVKKYHNVQLDGKPMKIEIVGTNIVSPAVAPLPFSGGIYGSQNGVPRSQRRGGFAGRSRGGGRRGGRGGGRGRGRDRDEKISTEVLDADLDNYHSGAMQTD